ncbi:MAG: hypothetical protein R3F46_00380 [bacterium]
MTPAEYSQPEMQEPALPERTRRFISGPLLLEQLELGQQLTTEQAEYIIEDLIERDRQFRLTPRRPEPYRARYTKGD